MASRPQSGNIGASPWQLLGPFVLRVFPSRFPVMVPAAPSTWQLRQGTDKLLRVDGLHFICRVSLSNSTASSASLLVFMLPFCVNSPWAQFWRVSRSSENTGNISIPTPPPPPPPCQFVLFLYGTSQFGWGTLLERENVVGLHSELVHLETSSCGASPP